MISIDQVLLLEQKVESAVAKIQQLQAENDALRIKCEELTNALSSKSEQLNTYETDQNKIEDGIRKALERLNTIENSVLRAATAQLNKPATVVHTAVVETPVTPTEKVEAPVSTPNPDTNPANHLIQHEFGAFDSMQEVPVSRPVNPQPVKPAPVPFTEDIPDTADYETEEQDISNDFNLEPEIDSEINSNDNETEIEPDIDSEIESDDFVLAADNSDLSSDISPIDDIFNQTGFDAEPDADFNSEIEPDIDSEIEPEIDGFDQAPQDFPAKNSSNLDFDIF